MHYLRILSGPADPDDTYRMTDGDGLRLSEPPRRLLTEERENEQHSGIEGERCFSEIGTIRDGRVILPEFFLEHDRALEALRMTE